jgi:rhamnulose-1-phosphate aldolase
MPAQPRTAAAILASMGKAGARLDHIGACEARAGNISVFSAELPPDLLERFPQHEQLKLPVPAPELAGGVVFVTGTDCRLRDVEQEPLTNVSAVEIEADGTTGIMHFADSRQFPGPTSEWNSHLGVHADQVATRGVAFEAVIHAQPPYLVTLSHIAALRNDSDLNRAIFRWEPETIVQVPAGIKVLDFMVPGSDQLGGANIAALRDHQIVLWSKHGVMVRSDDSPLAAVDKIEYVETGAMYEYRDRSWWSRPSACAPSCTERIAAGDRARRTSDSRPPAAHRVMCPRRSSSPRASRSASSLAHVDVVEVGDLQLAAD